MNVRRDMFTLNDANLSCIVDVLEIALNRAERRNALGKQLLSEVGQHLVEEWILFSSI